MKELDDWEKTIGGLMAGHSTPPPADGWLRLERELAAPTGRQIVWRPRRRLIGWAAGACAAAAAVAFLLLPAAYEVTGGGRSGGKENMARMIVAPQGDEAAGALAQACPSAAGRERAVAGRGMGRPVSRSAVLSAEREEKAGNSPVASASLRIRGRHPLVKENTTENVTEKNGSSAVTSGGMTGAAGVSSRRVRKKRLADEWASQLAVSKRRNIGVQLAVAGGPPAGFSSGGYAFRPVQMAAGSLAGCMPEVSQKVFSALLIENAANEVRSRVRHKFPLQVALTASVPLGGRFALESGVSYTRLQSEMSVGSPESHLNTRQTLRYVGIPLRLRYDLAAIGPLGFYAAAGGAAEVRVAGEQCTNYSLAAEQNGRTERHSVGRGLWQASLSLGAGAHCEILSRAGLFVEPGLTYYLPDGSSLASARHDHPLRFSLQVGLRWNLGRADKK